MWRTVVTVGLGETSVLVYAYGEVVRIRI